MKRSNVIVFCFVIFIPASSSPVLHCSVIPLCLEKHLVVSFFFFLQRSSVHCSFLSSVISCVEGGISCLFWPRWCLAPEQNELLWVGESQTSPSRVHPNCLSPNPGLHLSCCISLHLHLQLFIPSLYLPRPLLAP